MPPVTHASHTSGVTAEAPLPRQGDPLAFPSEPPAFSAEAAGRDPLAFPAAATPEPPAFSAEAAGRDLLAFPAAAAPPPAEPLAFPTAAKREGVYSFATKAESCYENLSDDEEEAANVNAPSRSAPLQLGAEGSAPGAHQQPMDMSSFFSVLDMPGDDFEPVEYKPVSLPLLQRKANAPVDCSASVEGPARSQQRLHRDCHRRHSQGRRRDCAHRWRLRLRAAV